MTSNESWPGSFVCSSVPAKIHIWRGYHVVQPAPRFPTWKSYPLSAARYPGILRLKYSCDPKIQGPRTTPSPIWEGSLLILSNWKRDESPEHREKGSPGFVFEVPDPVRSQIFRRRYRRRGPGIKHPARCRYPGSGYVWPSEKVRSDKDIGRSIFGNRKIWDDSL